MPVVKGVSCRDEYDPESITPAEALEQIFEAVNPVCERESVAIGLGLGRVLADDVVSSMNVPPAVNAAMDGYAVNSGDIPSEGVKGLRLIGASFAGAPFGGRLERGECVRIMTGAVLPAGADTVVMQEHAGLSGGRVDIDDTVLPGDNVRQMGEDVAAGDLVLAGGHRLTPADMGLLASLGIAEVRVHRRPRVAFFSTGDELRSVGEELDEGAIYDSNRYTLYGMLARLGVDVIDMGVVRDERTAIDAAFAEAVGAADALLTSGGVSVGEADFVRESAAKYGALNFWKVAMKPGRPLTFGKLGSTCFFGLPGNPVSVMVTFYQFVQPGLKRLAGEDPAPPVMMKVPCLSKLRKRAGRVEYQRGVLKYDEAGRLVVEKTGKQGSGILRSMSAANCFIVLPLESETVQPNEPVEVQPFYGIV